jgi:rhodanese-related sulfurtransferase
LPYSRRELHGTHKKNDISIIRELRRDRRNLIIDLRSRSQFRAVHIEGTTNIPMDEFRYEIVKIAPDKYTPIYLLCSRGDRSEEACLFLEKRGYMDITDLGALTGWKYGFVTFS